MSTVNISISPREASTWALLRYDAGLIPLPCWGGGNYPPGTHFRELAGCTPTREQVAASDYSGGLAIILGTQHPAGGYILGLDIDHGPATMPRPASCVYQERGTRATSHHIITLATDRLEGQLNLRDVSGELVAEIKGLGTALRCYPTLPPGKPQGYRPLFLAEPGELQPPTLTALQIADGLADYLTRVLARRVGIEAERPHYTGAIMPVSGALARQVLQELERRGIELSAPNGTGWQRGRCPMHQPDANPSFGVNLTLGAWRCFRCGGGGLRSLAYRLGIRFRTRRGHGAVAIPAFEVAL